MIKFIINLIHYLIRNVVFLIIAISTGYAMMLLSLLFWKKDYIDMAEKLFNDINQNVKTWK